MQAPPTDPLVLTPKSPSWPAGLFQATPPPERIWVRGRSELLAPCPAVAIVGSRAATPYGQQQAWRFAHDLTRMGVLVVSGLARGVDAAAHAGALDAGGGTIAVLGSGVDRPWPKTPLVERVAREGLLLSEYALGQGPRRHHFPLRNRLIAALTDAVLVIEGAHVSGSLITAHWAADMGREVFALPGRVDQPLAAGTLRLVREGASPVGSPAQLMEDLYGHGSSQALPAPEGPQDALGSALMEALIGETLGSEELATRTEKPLEDVLGRLVELELDGLLRRAPGGLYQRRQSSSSSSSSSSPPA
ncbi:MAG: DNA processing protein [Planctomycetota bacterium]